jgi:hypothetical protein
MSRSRLTLDPTLRHGLLAAVFAAVFAAAVGVATAGAASTGALILDLREDPLAPAGGSPLLALEGPGADQVAFDPATAPAHPSDAPGSLLVLYDAARPATRAAAALGRAYTEADDFVFGAIATIRPEGFHADPFGFHPITFSLINAATTGFNRTGSPADFRSDAFDTIDVAYFPQASPLFGGPFLAPGVFGSAVSDDAFASFAFGSVPFEIAPGVPHLITAEHLAAERRLVVTVHALGRGGLPVPEPGGRVEVGLASLAGFAVDAIAVTAYEDGFNVFAPSGRSLAAAVDYDLIFFAPGRLGPGGAIPPLAGLIRRDAEGARGLTE